MSQRRKGPGWPPTSSTIPSLFLPRPPRARAVLLSLPPNTRSSFSEAAPLEPVLVSVRLSDLPTRVQPWGIDWAGASAAARSLAPSVWSLPVPSCPLSVRM